MSLLRSHEKVETRGLLLLVLILVTVSIGGIVEIAPLYTIESTIEKVDGVRPYSPLELMGRNIYLREGCYNCHSQMVRPFRDEAERYGHYSLAAESMYDHPFQWGSKRTGPDLARVGGKYSNDWQVAHLAEPTSVVAKAWEQADRVGDRAWFEPHTVLVTGAGPIGLLAAMIGRLRGLEVHVLDRVERGAKPALVAELGATYHTGSVADVGFELHWGSALRWYLVDDSLADWPTASLDRVIGRNIDPWLTDAPAGHPWPRLQSETQMLLHTHPVNARREAQGLPTVNSVWLSGCGAARATQGSEPEVDDRLRHPALGEDWAAWADAWQALDAGPIASLLGDADATLTLAGERHAQAFTLQQPSAWQRLRALWQRTPAHHVLEAL